MRCGARFGRAAEEKTMKIDQTVLSAIIKAIPGDFAVYKIKGGELETVYASPGLPGISGMTKEEYDGVTIPDASFIVLESDRAYISNVLFKAASGSGETEITYRIIHKTRGFVWIHAKARMLGEMDGCPVQLVLFLNNSFETAEHASLLNHALGSIFVIDRASRELLYMNDKAMTHLGHGIYAGLTCYSYICGNDSPCEWCGLSKMVDGFSHESESYFPPLGKWFAIDRRAINWFGRDAVAIYALDVTERYRRQRSLELDNKSLQQIVGNIPVGVSVRQIRGDKSVSFAVNPYVCELLGITAKDIASVGEKIAMNTCAEDRKRAVAAHEELMEPGAHVEHTFRYTRPGETKPRWYHMNAKNVAQSDGSFIIYSCLSDVTAEKETEEELIRNRKMYTTAAELAGLSVWEYDIATHRITLSDSSATKADCDEFGFPHVMENIPESVRQWISGENYDKLAKMYSAIDHGAPTVSGEFWYKEGTGRRPRCQRITYNTFFNDNGRPVSAYGIGQDITAQKQEEEKYDRIIQELIDANSNALGTFRLNLTSNWCGDGRSPYPQVLELQKSGTADGFFNEVADDIVDEDTRANYRATYNCENLMKEFSGGKTHFYTEYFTSTPFKNKYWVSSFVNLIRHPGTGDIEAVTYTYDISDRKKEEEIVQRMTNEKTDYIGLIDPEANTFEFRNLNRSIRGLPLRHRMDYGICIDYDIRTFVAPEDHEKFRDRTAIARIISEIDRHTDYVFTYFHIENDGKMRKQLQYSWLNEERREILVIQSDITAAYMQEQEQMRRMKEALSAAERANSSKTEFLSRISHDIRTPISIGISMTDFAFEDIDDRAKLRGDLERIKASNTFLLSLINDVLDISKIDSGKIRLNPEPYTYEEHNANIRNMLEPMCEQKGLKCVIERRRKTGVIIADKIRLNQITLNLLSNAVKYTPAGGTVTYVSDSENLPDAKIRFGFEIRDTGIGMGEEFQKKMFEPFMQEYDNPLRPKASSGTGLGLSIVKKMVDLMHGTLTVKSKVGKGTTVRCDIVFPDAERDPKYKDVLTAKPAATETELPLSGKVLLAEDNAVNTEIAVRILEGFGLTTVTAGNGAEAVEKFSQSAPFEYGAVLMDIQMPIMNGYEAAGKIRSLPRADAASVPIIAMTADAFNDAIRRAYESGMTGHVTKPLDRALLRNVLRDCLYRPE
jgi:signal transduction histidine kinase/PAS domain-containing protein